MPVSENVMRNEIKKPHVIPLRRARAGKNADSEQKKRINEDKGVVTLDFRCVKLFALNNNYKFRMLKSTSVSHNCKPQCLCLIEVCILLNLYCQCKNFILKSICSNVFLLCKFAGPSSENLNINDNELDLKSSVIVHLTWFLLPVQPLMVSIHFMM